MEIKGKVALITGGGSGIGRATAIRLAHEGAAVMVADIDEKGCAETVKEIGGAGGRADLVRANVTQPEDARRMVDATVAKFGRLDILHNNAGIGTGPPGFPAAPIEQWRRVLEIDLFAVVLGCWTAAPAMERGGGGAIVNTASMAGLYPHRQDPIYGAAKGGVVHFTYSLANWAQERKIRVNCVCPGIVDTPMVQRGLERARAAGVQSWMPKSMLKASDIADAVVTLVRDDSLFGRAFEIRPTGRQLVDSRRAPGSKA